MMSGDVNDKYLAFCPSFPNHHQQQEKAIIILNRLKPGNPVKLLKNFGKAKSKRNGGFRSLKFNPFDKSLLASSTCNASPVLWDVRKDDEIVRSFEFTEGYGLETARNSTSFNFGVLQWDPHERDILYMAGINGIINCWDVRVERPVFSLSHWKDCGILNFEPCPFDQNKSLIASSINRTVVLWDLKMRNFMRQEKFDSAISDIIWKDAESLFISNTSISLLDLDLRVNLVHALPSPVYRIVRTTSGSDLKEPSWLALDFDDRSKYYQFNVAPCSSSLQVVCQERNIGKGKNILGIACFESTAYIWTSQSILEADLGRKEDQHDQIFHVDNLVCKYKPSSFQHFRLIFSNVRDGRFVLECKASQLHWKLVFLISFDPAKITKIKVLPGTRGIPKSIISELETIVYKGISHPVMHENLRVILETVQGILNETRSFAYACYLGKKEDKVVSVTKENKDKNDDIRQQPWNRMRDDRIPFPCLFGGSFDNQGNILIFSNDGGVAFDGGKGRRSLSDYQSLRDKRYKKVLSSPNLHGQSGNSSLSFVLHNKSNNDDPKPTTKGPSQRVFLVNPWSPEMDQPDIEFACFAEKKLKYPIRMKDMLDIVEMYCKRPEIVKVWKILFSHKRFKRPFLSSNSSFIESIMTYLEKQRDVQQLTYVMLLTGIRLKHWKPIVCSYLEILNGWGFIVHANMIRKYMDINVSHSNSDDFIMAIPGPTRHFPIIKCSVCRLTVHQSLIYRCSACGHGGHVYHVKAYFNDKEHKKCPIPWCQCLCSKHLSSGK